MNIKHPFAAVVLLAGASLLILPIAHAGVTATYDAYDDLSGTHASASTSAQAGMRGREGMAGESGSAGNMKASPSFFNVNQPYEEFMETRVMSSASQSGAQGRGGSEGQAGAAGKVSSGSSLFNLSGDVADGCSKHLRCSGD